MNTIEELSFEHKARDLARKLNGELVDVQSPNLALVKWPHDNSTSLAWFELTTDDEWRHKGFDLETLLGLHGRAEQDPLCEPREVN